jgi:predicted RNA-binding Zn-ribbon protein involved in translation (DUF1610 family)
MTAGVILNVSSQLVTVDCCMCGLLFAMPKELDDKLRRMGPSGTFWCPGCGKSQHYMSKSWEQQLAEAQAATVRERERRQAAEADHRQTELRLRAQRGVTTRLKNKINAGQCPCCTEKFPDLARHMLEQHPDYDPDAELSADERE